MVWASFSFSVLRLTMSPDTGTGAPANCSHNYLIKMKTSTRGESPLSATAGYASLVVDARVRYWDDAEINGIQDSEDGLLMPFQSGESWCPVIDLETGMIHGWPKGTTADIHYKVFDDGDYWLSDIGGNRVAKWKGLCVPDAFLCVGDRGYGDYIIMKVDGAGMIEGWTQPEIDPEEWEILQHNSWIINKSVRLSVFRFISDISMPFATFFQNSRDVLTVTQIARKTHRNVNCHSQVGENKQPGEAKPGQLEEDFRGVR